MRDCDEDNSLRILSEEDRVEVFAEGECDHHHQRFASRFHFLKRKENERKKKFYMKRVQTEMD